MMDQNDLTRLTDQQLLEICDLQMADDEQAELSSLLARNRENQLTAADIVRLDDLMQVYRHGLVRKANAIQVAVERGLKRLHN
jgi:hypothetical protein